MSERLPAIRRRLRSPSRLIGSLRRHAVALALAMVAPVCSATNVSDCLYRAFDIPPGETWGPNQIELAAGEWRVGHPRGAPVDAAAMKRHMARIGRVFIGGICTGSREGDTYRACGFALGEPVFAGQRYDDPDWYWLSTTGTALISVSDSGSAAMTTAFSVPEPLSVDGAPQDFVGLRAPAVLLRALRGGYGATLSFGFRAVLNPLSPAKHAASDGFVVLCSGGEGSSPTARHTPMEKSNPALRRPAPAPASG